MKVLIIPEESTLYKSCTNRIFSLTRQFMHGQVESINCDPLRYMEHGADKYFALNVTLVTAYLPDKKAYFGAIKTALELVPDIGKKPSINDQFIGNNTAGFLVTLVIQWKT